MQNPLPGVAVEVSRGKRWLSSVETLAEARAEAWRQFEASGSGSFDDFLAESPALQAELQRAADILGSALDALEAERTTAELPATGLLEYAEAFMARIDRSAKPRRYANFRTLSRRLREFADSRAVADFALSGFDSAFVQEFAVWLGEQRLMNTTVATYMRLLMALFNAAVSEGLARGCHPFRGLELDTLRVVPQPGGEAVLTSDDVVRLREADVQGRKALETVRGILLTAYETGLGLSQILDLRPADVKPDGLLCGTSLLPISQWLRERLTADLAADYCFYPSATIKKGSPRDKKKLEKRYEGRRVALARQLGMMPRLSMVGLQRLRKASAG